MYVDGECAVRCDGEVGVIGLWSLEIEVDGGVESSCSKFDCLMLVNENELLGAVVGEGRKVLREGVV